MYNPLNFSFSGTYRRLTSSSRTLPDFAVIGFPKCGTKSLFSYVAQHPNIGVPTSYGRSFFNVNYHRGLGWYKSHYPTVENKKKLKKESGEYFFGDYSASYMMWYESALKIKKVMPRVKLIVVLRNPVDRAYSQFNFKEQGRFRETIDNPETYFSDAIKDDEKRLKNWEYMIDNNLINRQNHVATKTPYLTMGKYAIHLKEWFKVFPKEQFHFVPTDEMSNEINIQKTVSKVYKFLGLPDYEINDFSRKNVGSYERIDEKQRDKVKDFYKPWNAELEEMLGMKFNWN